MPGRNVTKIYVEEAFYHLYNRGINKATIFLGQEDFRYFEWLLQRTLDLKPTQDHRQREYTWLRQLIELNAYCLMPNHFHLLVHQMPAAGITKLMLSIATSYTLYFNKKYKRRGPLFESSYRAVHIRRDAQLMHITRYIHLNHKRFRNWPHSSFDDYLGEPRGWIASNKIIELFPSRAAYREFVFDYEQAQRERDKLKRELADSY